MRAFSRSTGKVRSGAQLWLATRRTSGQSLDGVDRLERPRAARIGVQIADQLAAMQDAGVAPDEIGPADIVLEGADGGERAWLLPNPLRPQGPRCFRSEQVARTAAGRADWRAAARRSTARAHRTRGAARPIRGRAVAAPAARRSSGRASGDRGRDPRGRPRSRLVVLRRRQGAGRQRGCPASRSTRGSQGSSRVTATSGR